MKIIKKFKEYIKYPARILLDLDRKRIITLKDETFCKLKFKDKMGFELNLNNPCEFNEKLNYLKLYDHNEKYKTFVDKYAAKEYFGNVLGNEYIVPLIGVYDSFDEIDFSKLPNQFVIKCNHNSGGIVICKDKEKFDIETARKTINKHFKYNYFYTCREWPYKDLKRKIIIEEFLEDTKYHELRDYKVYAFNGKADYLMLCFDRFIDKTKFIYFDRKWKIKKEFSNDGIKYGDSIVVDKPKNLDKMFEFAEKLSKGIPFARVDFYEVNGKLYFGELTLYPSGGFDNTRTKQICNYLDKNLII